MLTHFERGAAKFRRMQGYPDATPSLPNWRLGHNQGQRKDTRVPLEVARPCGHGAYPQGHLWAAPTSVARMRQGALPGPHPPSVARQMRDGAHTAAARMRQGGLPGPHP